jgi:hypothetical protein
MRLSGGNRHPEKEDREKDGERHSPHSRPSSFFLQAIPYSNCNAKDF